MSKYCIEKQGPALYAECTECKSMSCMRFVCLATTSGGFADYAVFSSKVKALLENYPRTALAETAESTGGFARRYAEENNIPCITLPGGEDAYRDLSRTLIKGAVHFSYASDTETLERREMARRHGIQARTIIAKEKENWQV